VKFFTLLLLATINNSLIISYLDIWFLMTLVWEILRSAQDDIVLYGKVLGREAEAFRIKIDSFYKI